MNRRHLGRIAYVFAPCALLPLFIGAGCPGIVSPVDPSRYAGCWRFQVRGGNVERDLVDRDFIIDIDATGAVTRVIMRDPTQSVAIPNEATARFQEFISADVAANLQASFFAGRVGGDATMPDVVFNQSISATDAGFSIDAAVVLAASGAERFALSVDVFVSGTAITDVDGSFRDNAGALGDLTIQRLLDDPGFLNAQVSCPATIETVCNRLYETTRSTMQTRFTAFDAVPGLAGRAIVASGNVLQFFDLDSGLLRQQLTLASEVLAPMAVDPNLRRLYVPTRNSVGNNVLTFIDLDGLSIIRSAELKPAGCVNFGTPGGCAVLPMSGDILVVIRDSAEPDFDGILRINSVDGRVMGAIQNAHLTADAFNGPIDLAVFEGNNLAIVANNGDNELTAVPIDGITRSLVGGSGEPCVMAARSGTLNTFVTGGDTVQGIASNLDGGNGAILVQGAGANDGMVQSFLLIGAGSNAILTFAPLTSLARPARLFGITIDDMRDDVYVANGDGDTFVIDLTSGVTSQIGNVATADVTFVTPVVGRDRVLQMGNNSFFEEACLP